MGKLIKRIVVTGGAGQISYNLLFRIASGEVFGPEQPVALNILEIPEALVALEGVRMELEDCAFPLLTEILIGSDPKELFHEVDFAILVGAKPRGPGMERADLLRENSKIFMEQGKALNEVANSNAKVLVVGNPCNTNCWITMKYAPNIPRENFHAMTRLDQNRAIAQLAIKADVPVNQVSNMAIWGNHSNTQVPDYCNAKIGGKPATDIITDEHWFDQTFIPTVQQRGAVIISARGKSSAASAANAVVDSIRSLYTPTHPGDWFSSAVYTRGNPYGFDEDIIFSMPCRSSGDGNYEIIGDVTIDKKLKEKMKATEQEIIQEREQVNMGVLHG